MASSSKKTITFRRGDDFMYDMSVKNKNTAGALAALAVLTSAQADLVAANAAVPIVPQDVIDAEAAIVVAQAAYDLAIIVDITGWTIEAELTWADKVIDTLTVNITNASLGEFTLIQTDDVTITWPKRLLDADIRFDIPVLGKRSAKTFCIDLQEW